MLSISMRRFALVLALLAAACGPPGRGATKVSHPERATSASAAVSDEAFAGAVRDLLASEPGSAERASRLNGVAARQMERVVARFKAKAPERGLGALLGAQYLMRTGELQANTLGPAGPEAMTLAAVELSHRGDEGRARGVFEILARVGDAKAQADARTHLDALRLWFKDSAGDGVRGAGALERAAVMRFLVEPSAQARDEALQATRDWIAKALALRDALQRGEVGRPPPQEANEAVRALGTGAMVLVALHVKDLDVDGGLADLNKSRLKQFGRSQELTAALEALESKREAGRWLDVVRALTPQREAAPRDDEEVEEKDLLRAAGFSAVVEAYRLDPTLPEAAGAIAGGLEELGMAEAAPAVLVDAVKAHPDPRIISGALAITMHAMVGELNAEDADAVRRTFAAAQPILAVADKQPPGKLNPTPGRARATMGEIELREGRLEAARTLFDASLASEKSGSVLLSLARIDVHDQKIAAALDHLREALAAPDTAKDPALRGEILLNISDVTREQGDGSAARTPLTEALKELARARNTRDAEDRARAERLLSRVLDRFGASQPAERALDRALEAAPRDKRQAAATVGQIVARAFVKGDLKAAREGLRRGLVSDLDNDDLVYYALWVRLLERQLRVPTDGVADKIFASAADEGRWLGKLSAFGAGRIKAEQLTAAAQTPAQKTEALFYSAMDRRVSGDAKGSDDVLRQVLTAGGLELMEFAIAREMLAGDKSRVPGPLPEVQLP
jgi:tetratricopeptide (TPR) repeat protein